MFSCLTFVGSCFESAGLIYLFFQQVLIIVAKNVRQRWVAGRTSIKLSVLVPFCILGFTSFALIKLQQQSYSDANYSLRPLTPLSKASGGVFDIYAPYHILARNLWYSPNSHSGVNELMNSLAKQYPDVRITGFASEDAMLKTFPTNVFNVWCAVVFNLTNSQLKTGAFAQGASKASPATVSYAIRVNPNVVALPNVPFDEQVYNNFATDADGWLDSGYLTLQNYIRTYVVNAVPSITGKPQGFKAAPLFQRFPRSSMYPNTFEIDEQFARYFLWKYICPIVWTIALILPMLSFLREVVREKETGMRQLLEVSGMMPLAYWTGHVSSIFVYMLITVWVMIGFLYGVHTITSLHISPYAYLLYCYVIQLATAGMVFGLLVFKTDYYALTTFAATLITAVGGLFVAQNGNFDANTKLAFAFFVPASGFAQGIFIIEAWFFSNPNSPIDYNYAFSGSRNLPSLNDLLNTMLGSALIYIFLAWGYPYDWVFRRDNAILENVVSAEDSISHPFVSDGSKAGGDVLLRVKGLSFVYPDGTHAIKGLSFNVNEGEIVSYLGGNGAGKSTTLNLLCGTLKATVGDAFVSRFSISAHTTKARRTLGVCTQQDVLWSDLSTYDNLLIFGLLRGTPLFSLVVKVSQMVEDLGFPEKTHLPTSQLSRGQKRRLCTAMSMIGDNKVVFLDEPTAGVDLASRRKVWDLIQKHRTGRAILLTTNFMDEADALGDRIAIVKEGRLRCMGSSAFLKKTFGVGYLLRCSLLENSNADSCFDIVSRQVDNAQPAANVGSELSIVLPRNGISKFPAMFEQLETQGRRVGLASFGIETTTLEEVFVRIANEDIIDVLANPLESNTLIGASHEERRMQDELQALRDDVNNPLTSEMIDVALTKGIDAKDLDANCSNFFTQIGVIFVKRFNQFTRSKGQVVTGLCVPLMSICVICLLLHKLPSDLLLGPNPAAVILKYSSPYNTIVAANNFSDAKRYVAPLTKTSSYAGQNYASMYNYVNGVAKGGNGVSSSEAIAFGANSYNYTIMYNASYPINLAGATVALLEGNINDFAGDLLQFAETNQYLPYTYFGPQVNIAYYGALLFGVLCGSLGASLSIVISGERISGTKSQQLASGASVFAYWFANFLWDFAMINGMGLIFSIALAVTNNKVWGGEGWGVVFVASMFYALAAIFRFYCFSYFISDVKFAQALYFFGTIGIMFGVLTLWGSQIFSGTNGNADITSDLAQFISACCTVIEPAFGYFLLIAYCKDAFGIRTLSNNAPVSSVLSLHIGGPILVAQMLLFVVCGTILSYIELGGFIPLLRSVLRFLCCPCIFVVDMCTRCLTTDEDDDVRFIVDNDTDSNLTTAVSVTPLVRTTGQPDPDVLAEREKVQMIYDDRRLKRKSHAIFLHKLSKVYFGRGNAPAKVAVNEINLVIGQGEIFGLLGANGAGKTALLKMASGLEVPTSGLAKIDSYNIVTQRSLAQRSMGLCPQTDMLVERLSVKENLTLFAKIKGIRSSRVEIVVETMMIIMNIKHYESKPILQLSYGNRRKVSLIVALIGAPATVYLDEPSTGLDPVASRNMWRLLKIVAARKQHAIFLTTHNMLECEAVCSRVGIMKAGELVCLGNSQHLRSSYGTGFLLELTLEDASHVEAAKAFVTSAFLNATLVDEYIATLQYEFPVSSVSKLSIAFQVIEDNKSRLQITNYSLSQSTLAQVFLKQIRPTGTDAAIDEDRLKVNEPYFSDYAIYFLAVILAIVIPGLHHFVLRNNRRGVLYFFTWNEVMAGWLLDVFDARNLVGRSVQEFGHINICKCWLLSGCSCCASVIYACCYYCWCCCFGCCPRTCPPPGAAAHTPVDNIDLAPLPHRQQPSSDKDIEMGDIRFSTS